MTNVSLAKLLFESEKHPLLSAKTAEAIFKYFHLSDAKLGRQQTFTFTPRQPRTPYSDIEGNIIEDDFTERVSLAPSIEKALKALPVTSQDYSVYAGDIKLDPTDDIETVDLSQVPGPAYIDPYTQKLQRYGPKFKLLGYIVSQEKNNVAWGEWPLSPSKLNEPYKSDFEYAVPDAKSTKEEWALAPITMIYLGKLLDHDTIELSHYAKSLLLKKGLISQADLL